MNFKNKKAVQLSFRKIIVFLIMIIVFYIVISNYGTLTDSTNSGILTSKIISQKMECDNNIGDKCNFEVCTEVSDDKKCTSKDVTYWNALKKDADECINKKDEENLKNCSKLQKLVLAAEKTEGDEESSKSDDIDKDDIDKYELISSFVNINSDPNKVKKVTLEDFKGTEFKINVNSWNDFWGDTVTVKFENNEWNKVSGDKELVSFLFTTYKNNEVSGIEYLKSISKNGIIEKYSLDEFSYKLNIKDVEYIYKYKNNKITSEIIEQEGMSISNGKLYLGVDDDEAPVFNYIKNSNCLWNYKENNNDIYLTNYELSCLDLDNEKNIKDRNELSSKCKNKDVKSCKSLIEEIADLLKIDKKEALALANTENIWFDYLRDSYDKSSTGLLQVKKSNVNRNKKYFDELKVEKIVSYDKEFYLNDPEINIGVGLKIWLDFKSQVKTKIQSNNIICVYAAYNGGVKALGDSIDCPGLFAFECKWNDRDHTTKNTGYSQTRSGIKRFYDFLDNPLILYTTCTKPNLES